MDFDLPTTIDLLGRTPGVLDRLLRGTAPAWHEADEGPDTWSARIVVGHLVHGEETDWIPRARLILDGNADRPFEPFDRFAQFDRFAEWPLDALLDRFAELRRANLDALRGWHLTEDQLALPGLHPALGPVRLHQLLATWAVHDLSHVAQVARVMAKAYAGAVGPWEAYLPILSR